MKVVGERGLSSAWIASQGRIDGAAGRLVVVVLVFILVLLASAIRVVREYERLVLFRLGRSLGIRGPGLVLIFPIIDRVVNVDLREAYLEIPHQTAITKDNASISIDFVIFHKVVDAVTTVLQVEDFAGAAQNVATTTLRSVVGDMSLDDVLAKRDAINELLRVKLDEITERWGVKVTNVEIREVIPPPVVQEAMTRQMSAERTRRAVVTEAEGQRQATITVAEGDKQAQILTAEGDAAGRDPRGRGTGAGPRDRVRRRQPDRREDDGPAVPRRARGARRVRVDEVRDPDGVREHPGRRRELQPRGLPGTRDAVALSPSPRTLGRGPG